MQWAGKAFGGILGLIAGGPIGSLLGLVLGHQFDRVLVIVWAAARAQQARRGRAGFSSRRRSV